MPLEASPSPYPPLLTARLLRLTLTLACCAGGLALDGLPGRADEPAAKAPTSDIDSAPPPDLPIERRSPKVRTEGLAALELPGIPASAISPFLNGVRVSDDAEGAMPGARPVTALPEGHRVAGIGEPIYVEGLGSGTDWDIYRRGLSFVDPDTGKRLGTELVPVGEARLDRAGATATLIVRRASREIGVGDLVVPHADTSISVNYRPQVPVLEIDARVMSIYGGRSEQSSLGSGLELDRPGATDFERRREAGPLQVVTLNRGRTAGLEPGNVLALHRTQRIVDDRSTGPYYQGEARPRQVDLPEQRYGLVFVFRTFEHVSYALVVRGDRSAAPGDHARNP
jgi:hypothetical protein